MKRAAAIIAALFALNAWLYFPLFLPGEWPYRESIEGGYAAMARFFAAHPNPWGWNPFVYCGLPSQFTYLPGLHYFAAIWIRLFSWAEPHHVYRAVTAVFACLAPAAVFWFVMRRTGSRAWALAAGLAYSVFSPAYGLLRVIEDDKGVVDLPWRLQVLVKYGEGPHTAGLVLLILALGAVWSAGMGKTYRTVLVAAVALASVALTHWIAAFALALCCVMMLLALAGTDEFRFSRIAGAGLLGYLLAGFWLTPSFVRTIAFNWPADAFGYHMESAQKWLLLGAAAGLVAVRACFGRKPAHPYFCFLSLCAFLFGYLVLFYDARRLDTIPESRRYSLEFELFLVLWVSEALRLMFKQRDRAVRIAAVVSAALMLAGGWRQAADRFTQKYSAWRLRPKEQTVEYRIARWLDQQHPRGRIFASGGLRYQLNSWFDLPQVGGTFETGLRNRVPLDLAYKIRTDTAPAGRTLDLLRALDVEYVVVHGARSEEHFRDFRNPGRFDGLLDRVWAERDDVVYRVPGYRPALDWKGTSAVRALERTVPLNYDPGWTAAAPLSPAPEGFVRAGDQPTEMRYKGTMEPKLMAGASLLAWLAALGALRRYR